MEIKLISQAKPSTVKSNKELQRLYKETLRGKMFVRFMVFKLVYIH